MLEIISVLSFKTVIPESTNKIVKKWYLPQVLFIEVKQLSCFSSGSIWIHVVQILSPYLLMTWCERFVPCAISDRSFNYNFWCSFPSCNSSLRDYGICLLVSVLHVVQHVWKLNFAQTWTFYCPFAVQEWVCVTILLYSSEEYQPLIPMSLRSCKRLIYYDLLQL